MTAKDMATLPFEVVRVVCDGSALVSMLLSPKSPQFRHWMDQFSSTAVAFAFNSYELCWIGRLPPSLHSSLSEPST